MTISEEIHINKETEINNILDLFLNKIFPFSSIFACASHCYLHRNRNRFRLPMSICQSPLIEIYFYEEAQNS